MNICAVCRQEINFTDYIPPAESEVVFTVAETDEGSGIVVQGTTTFVYCAKCARESFFESRLPKVRSAALTAARKRK